MKKLGIKFKRKKTIDEVFLMLSLYSRRGMLEMKRQKMEQTTFLVAIFAVRLGIILRAEQRKRESHYR